MSPRQPKEQGEINSPNNLTAGGGTTASKDHLYEIFQRLTSIENSLSFITASVDDSKTKIESTSKEVAEAKAKFETLKTAVSWAAKGIWAIVLLLVTFGLSILGMWMKNHYGWK